MENSFRELRKKLKRQNKDFLYFAVKELSPSGMWHIHGLWNIYIDIKELSSIWENISGAYRVDLRKVRNPKGAVNYLFKYLFKSAHNAEEKRLLYENDKRKFSNSKSLFHKLETANPYTTDFGIDYSVSELKEKLLDMVRNSNCTVDDFDTSEYPYFDDLIENIFSAVFENDFFY